jgi:transmembrane sensor
MENETTNHRLLVQRYVQNKCTAEELEVFFYLLKRGELTELLNEDMAAYQSEPEQVKLPNKKARVIRWQKFAAAAIVLLVVMGGLKYLLKDRESIKIAESAISAADKKAPMNSGASITLSNGETVFLDSTQKGALAMQGNVRIVRLADGSISYKGASNEIVFNTLTNPIGSKLIEMELADGTRVWLNSGSSITYPTSFVQDTRNVSVTGEAYFEVKRDAKKPFQVKVNNLQIQVLGTHFNVNGYAGEMISCVTLLEGSIKIKNSITEKLLKPGDQAKINTTGDLNITANADIEEAIAWKEGNFQFEDADIHSIMRQVARWYGVSVEYRSDTKAHFDGIISRAVNLAKVLEMLQQTGEIKFVVEGNRVIVSPV